MGYIWDLLDEILSGRYKNSRPYQNFANSLGDLTLGHYLKKKKPEPEKTDYDSLPLEIVKDFLQKAIDEQLDIKVFIVIFKIITYFLFRN